MAVPPLDCLLADRARLITGSVIDASTSLLQERPGDVIRLAMGSPARESIPTATFARLLVHESARADAFDYAATEGDPVLRGALIEFLGRNAHAPEPEQLLVTTGGMQGLDLVCKAFVGAGDTVAIEAPTYTNGAATIASYRGEMLEVPGDDNGMDVDALPRLAAQRARPPKLIYTIPTFQNPSGTTLTLERRLRLLELAAEWDAVILEDDPYSMLRFAGDPLPTLQQLAGDAVRVVGVQTFSKILAPGLRIGWVTAEPELIELMVKARQGMDTCTNTLQQRLVARFILEGHLDAHLAGLQEEYARRKRAMQRALVDELAGLDARWTDPQGGFFLWLELPEPFDADVAFPVALDEGVAYIPGSAFSVSGRFRNALRLAFSAEAPERLGVGVARLRRALDRQLART
jgi:2-aminoadipate transaminase